MTIFVGILALVLLVLTFMVISRLISLTRTVSGRRDDPGSPGLANQINAALFPIVFIVGTIASVWAFMVSVPDFLPEASSEHGVKIDTMFWWFMGIVLVGFYITAILLFFFSYRYRYQPERRATYYPVNHKLELYWTVVPAVAMAIMVFMGWRVWRDITQEAPANAYAIDVMGKQFNWYARYPGEDSKLGNSNYKMTSSLNDMGIDYTDEYSFDDVQSNTLYLPKGVPVLLKIRARDVLHSVYLPHMRVKMDAVPGMPTKFWFTATKTTQEMKAETNDPKFEYRLNCTEICGEGHFGMKMAVVVLEENEFKDWLKSQKPHLAGNPGLLDVVPQRLKARAMKYMDAPAEEQSATDSTAVAVAALR